MLQWIELVDKYVRSSSEANLPTELVDLLRLLIEERKNDSYVSPEGTLDRTKFKSFEAVSSLTHNDLCEIHHFRQTASKKDYDKSKGLLFNLDRLLCVSYRL
jgi:hypothetical protein